MESNTAVARRGNGGTTPVHEMTRYVATLSGTLAECLPRGVPTERFVRAAQTALLKDPTGKLSRCTQQSVLHSLMECAATGLMPDGRQAALIAYGNECKFSPMVEGIIDLMHRAPGVEKIEARVVRRPAEGEEGIEPDDFEYEYGIESVLRHVPRCPPSSEDFDPRVCAAYAIIWWSNGAQPTFEVLDRTEIDRARRMGQGSTPMWKQWYGEGARKVAVKRISKYVDLEPEAAALIALDHELETGEARRSRRADPDRTASLNAALAEKANGAETEEPEPGPGKWHLDDCPAGYGLWAEQTPSGGWYFPARVKDPGQEPAETDLICAKGEDEPRKMQRADALEAIRAFVGDENGNLL